jgi:hypothetical protein
MYITPYKIDGAIMKNKKYILIGFISISIAFSFWLFSLSIKANAFLSNETIDTQQIKKIIDSYFDARGKSFNNLKLEDFDALIFASTSNSVMQTELEKLDLEIYHADLFQLRYQTYKYYLDFESIEFNLTTDIATINIIEGRDVVFEISAPTISKFRNVHHTILLKKENGDWKITSDQYEDFLWRILKSPNLSISTLRNSLPEAKKNLAAQSGKGIQSSPMTPQDSGTYTIRSYYGLGAANYADYWYDKFNPVYYNFTGLGGDCTNFVSQAMYEGGSAVQTGKCDINNYCDGGWYYIKNLSPIERSPSWAGVVELYDFLVTHKNLWTKGPFAEEVYPDIANNNFQPLYFGDIIQYDWEPNGEYNHSVIIDGFTGGVPQIASHSDAYRDVPYTYNIYDYPNQTIRFIHILGVKIPNIFIPMEYYDYGNSTASQLIAYPAPGQTISVGNTPRNLGYPTPTPTLRAYPAP